MRLERSLWLWLFLLSIRMPIWNWAFMATWDNSFFSTWPLQSSKLLGIHSVYYTYSMFTSVLAFILFSVAVVWHQINRASDTFGSKNVSYCLETLATIYQFMTAEQENLKPSLYPFIWARGTATQNDKDWLSRQKHHSLTLEPNSE